MDAQCLRTDLNRLDKGKQQYRKERSKRSPATKNDRGKGNETTTGSDVLSESAKASQCQLTAADAGERSTRHQRRPTQTADFNTHREARRGCFTNGLQGKAKSGAVEKVPSSGH